MQTDRQQPDDDFSLRLVWGEGDPRDESSEPASAPPTAPAATVAEAAGPRSAAPVEAGGDAAELVAQVRLVRAQVEQLRADVAALSGVVLDQPALGALTEEVAALRRDVTARAEQEATGPALVPTADVGPLLEAVTALRDEVTSLRRRIALRADSDDAVDEASMERLADLVAARLAAGPAAGRRAKR